MSNCIAYRSVCIFHRFIRMNFATKDVVNTDSSLATNVDDNTQCHDADIDEQRKKLEDGYSMYPGDADWIEDSACEEHSRRRCVSPFEDIPINFVASWSLEEWNGQHELEVFPILYVDGWGFDESDEESDVPQHEEEAEEIVGESDEGFEEFVEAVFVGEFHQNDDAYDNEPYQFYYDITKKVLLLCVAYMMKAHEDLQSAIILHNAGNTTPANIVYFLHAMTEKAITALHRLLSHGWSGGYKGDHSLHAYIRHLSFRVMEDGEEIDALLREACTKFESLGGGGRSVCLRSRYPDSYFRERPAERIPALVFQGEDFGALICLAKKVLSKASEVLHRYCAHSLPLKLGRLNNYLLIGDGFNGPYTMTVVANKSL